MPAAQTRYIRIPIPHLQARQVLRFSVAGFLLLLSHLLIYRLALPPKDLLPAEGLREPLYLMEQAATHVGNAPAFAEQVRLVAGELDIPPEWLMAVMYAESGFDPAVMNRQGSGAVGLIQFMPETAAELQVSSRDLRDMSPLAQLSYVQAYFQQVRRRYGPYQDLTDLYLAVLYPKARGQQLCYALYARPSLAYRQNAGLDENRDGRVTIADIDRRMRRLFPKAYVTALSAEASANIQ